MCFLGPASFQLGGTITRWWLGPCHASEVVGDDRQHPLGRHRRQSSSLELAHTTLLFQDPEHRFHHRLPPLINAASLGTAQLLPQALMFHIPDRLLADPMGRLAGLHLVSQVVVGHVQIDAPPLHLSHRTTAEKSRISRYLLRRRSATLFHLIHHGHKRSIVGGILRHSRGHNQVIVAHRQVRRVAQLPAPRRAQKAAVGIGLRDLGSSFLGQRRNGLSLQRLLLLGSQAKAALFSGLRLARLLLKPAHQPPVPRPLLPALPFYLHHTAPRSIGPHPRGINGHMSQLAQPRPSRHLHHLG